MAQHDGLGPQFEKFVADNPLLTFSFYTQIQVDILTTTGKETCELLDAAFGDSGIDANSLNKVYGFFWLWVLGAYEVTRTMTQAKTPETECFSKPAMIALTEFKNNIAVLRMPFAKQEFQGQHKPIDAEASIGDIYVNERDIAYVVKDKVFSVRKTIAEFDRVMKNIGLWDVKREHGESYQKPETR